jgi:hypothetical protein
MLALGTIVVVECPPACFLLLPELATQLLLLKVVLMHLFGDIKVRSRMLHPQAGNWHCLLENVNEGTSRDVDLAPVRGAAFDVNVSSIERHADLLHSAIDPYLGTVFVFASVSVEWVHARQGNQSRL